MKREPAAYEEILYERLKERGQFVTTAESLTGGLLAGRIINVPGASDIYKEGFITYSDEAKHELLGVSEETLQTYSAVSRACACEMARGAAQRTGADLALVTTGIAGPSGGSNEKPVGLVYIGLSYQGEVTVHKCRFHGTRAEIRQQTVTEALRLALQLLNLTIS